MKGKRFLSLLLCLVMVLSCLPISVFAEETPKQFKLTVVENHGTGNAKNWKLKVTSGENVILAETTVAGAYKAINKTSQMVTGTQVVVEVTAADSYIIDGADFYTAIPTTAPNESKKIQGVDLKIDYATDKKSAKITFTLTNEQIKPAPVLVVKLKADGYTVNFYPYASIDGYQTKTFQQTVKTEAKLSEPTEADIIANITGVSSDYIKFMIIEVWFT